MTALNKIAYFQNRRDEIPNQELARELALSKDTQSIREIADNLHNSNPNIQADCIKVLYELGSLEPLLVAEYAQVFLALLKSKNNRLVWGAMSALSSIAAIRSREIGAHLPDLYAAMETGSVITVDNGVQVLALVAANNPDQGPVVFSYPLNHLRTCRLKEVPQHAERILPAVNGGNKSEFIDTLTARMDQMSPSQTARLKKVIKAAEKR